MEKKMDIIPLTQAHIESPMWDSADEFERMHGRLTWHMHTPYAHAICAEVHEEVAGIGTAVRFGDSARITACKLVTGHDGMAVRARLVERLLNELSAEGCNAFTVTVPPAQVPHWEALGFAAQEALMRYSGGRFYEAVYPDVVWIEPQHRLAVMHLDRQASGEDRRQLLLEHEYIGRAYLDGKTVRGFALALLGNALIVAESPSAGLELQRWIFPTQAEILVPEGNAPAHAHLLERGYSAHLEGVRMVRGEQRVYRPELIYGEPYGVV
jgi:Acetyltransferase (GNAT) domain